ncbi:MAG: hypothetical protein ACRDRZ_03615 [Pseudonocardiaceae bacterium]
MSVATGIPFQCLAALDDRVLATYLDVLRRAQRQRKAGGKR